jgi:hypothetical protein
VNPITLTYTGKYINVMNLQPEDIDIEDIAHALSMQCRYNGHVREFYSVAEHCFRLSLVVPDELAKVALMHDASEAYCGDLVLPIKRVLPQFGDIEDPIHLAIFERFGLNLGDLDHIAYHDRAISIDEMGQLMESVDPFLLTHYSALNIDINPMTPSDAKHAFLSRFYELFPNEA